MKTIYESFEELAAAFVDGESWTHRLSSHPEADCLAWMAGIREFARWLDRGIKVPVDPAIFEKLWDP